MALMLCLVSIYIYSDNISSKWVNIGGQNVEITYHDGSIYSVFWTDGKNTTYLTDEDAKDFVKKARERARIGFYKGTTVNYRLISVDTNIVYHSFYAIDKNIISENDLVAKVVMNGEVRFLYKQFYYTPILRTYKGRQYWYFIVHSFIKF